MGFLDVSLPDPSTVVEKAKEHGNTLGLLAGAAGTGIGASAVAGTPLTAIVVPLLAQSYFEAAADDVFTKTEKSLQKTAENRSGSLVRVCDGLCQLIDPLVQDETGSGQSLEQVARDDPEKVQRLFEQLLTDDQKREKLEQVEQTLATVFAGETPPEGAPIQSNDPEAIIATLQDVFDADDKREALHLYTVYSEFLTEVTSEVQETGTERPELADAIESVETRLEQVEHWTTEIIDTFTLLTLKNQAFTQLTALDFERQDPFQSKPPRYLWLTGFNFAELAARHDPTNDPYYFERTVPAGHELAAGESEPPESVSEAIIDELEGGTNVMLTGPPGAGKSHLCRRVAAAWYSDSRGEVFYRMSAADKPFQQDAELEEAIKNAETTNGGQTLVVVEDAVADHANRIFEVMDEFRRRPDADVCFLLDSRQSQWDAYASDSQPHNEPPTFVRLTHENGESNYLSVIDVPPLTEQDCREAIETFNRTTSGYYGPPEEMADRLYDAVSDDGSIQAGLVVLADELVTNSQFRSGTQGFVADAPVRDSAGDLHAQWLETLDQAGDEPPLGYQIAIAVSTLTAADVDLSVSLLYALASDRREIKSVAEILDGSADLPVEIRGTLLIPDEGAVTGFATRHTQWAFEFLASQLDAGTAAADTLHETFVQTVSTIAGLADDPQRRSNIAQWLNRNSTEAPFLERLEKHPQQTIEDFLEAIVSLGQKQDGQLAPLLEESFLAGCVTDQRNVPDVCSPEFRFELEIQRGWILRQTAGDDRVANDPERVFETIIEEAVEALTPPERDWIRARAAAARAEIAKDRLRYPDAVERFETAIEHYESIDRTYQAASTYRRLANLGRTTETLQWDAVRERYRRAIELFEDEHERQEVLRTATACASAALVTETVNWNEVVTHQEHALDLYEASEPRPKVAYWYRRTLREHSQVERESSALDWEVVETRYRQAITAYAAAEYDLIVARLCEELGTAASETDALAWDEIRALFERSVSTYSSRDLNRQVGRVYQSMAKVSREYEAVDWSDTEGFYDDAVSQFEEIGAGQKTIEVLRDKADAAYRTTGLAWSRIKSYYEDTITACERDNAPTDAAQTVQNLAEAAAARAPDFETVDAQYQRAIERFETLGHSTKAARLAKRRAEVAADRDEVEWSLVTNAYQTAIEHADRLGLDLEGAHIKRSLARAAKTEVSDWDTVERYYEQAATAFETNGLPTKAAMTRRWLAEAAAKEPQVPWERAKQYYEQSTAQFEANENTFEVARNHRLLADAALDVGALPWDEMESQYLHAIETYENAGHPDRIAKTYAKLGRAASTTDNVRLEDADEYFASALEWSEEVTPAHRSMRIRIALDAAEIFLEAGSTPRAVAWLETAIETWRDAWTASPETTSPDCSTLCDLAERIADCVPRIISQDRSTETEALTEQWCRQLAELTADGPTNVHEALTEACNIIEENDS